MAPTVAVQPASNAGRSNGSLDVKRVASGKLRGASPHAGVLAFCPLIDDFPCVANDLHFTRPQTAVVMDVSVSNGPNRVHHACLELRNRVLTLQTRDQRCQVSWCLHFLAILPDGLAEPGKMAVKPVYIDLRIAVSRSTGLRPQWASRALGGASLDSAGRGLRSAALKHRIQSFMNERFHQGHHALANLCVDEQVTAGGVFLNPGPDRAFVGVQKRPSLGFRKEIDNRVPLIQQRASQVTA